MKKEKWLIWKPIEEIPPTFWLEDFEYSEALLSVGVQDQLDKSAPKLIFSFHNFLTMHITDEGNLLKDTCDVDENLKKINKKPGYYYRWSLFTVEDSQYVQWFEQQMLNEGENIDIAHYVIKTPNEIVEVLSSKDYPPVLKWNE